MAKYNLGTPIYTSDFDEKLYMFIVKDSSSFCKKISFIVESAEGDLSNKFDLSFQKFFVPNNPLEFLYNVGFGRDEILKITNLVKEKLQKEKEISTEERIPIERVHQILTKKAFEDDEFLTIDGEKCCAFQTNAFRQKVKEMELGYKNHLEILHHFRLMGILRGSKQGETMRNDYRGTDHVPYYCFLPAEGIIGESNIWGVQ